MSSRQAAFSYTPTSVNEAQGVTINRVIGGDRMAILDPFILLDHASIEAASDVVGFHRHPHRGIETLSYVLKGEVGHKDSLGNEGIVGPGGTQWMTAGNGIWHEEMMKAGPDGAEMLQLWFSLPADKKRIPAGYVNGPSETVPQVDIAGGAVRVVAGSFNGTNGIFQEIAVRPTILDVTLEEGAAVTIPTDADQEAFLYVVRGSATAGGHTATEPKIIVFAAGEQVEVTAGVNGARFLFCAAKPLGEPILQYRSFVMNTPEDIRETLAMIGDGTFGS